MKAREFFEILKDGSVHSGRTCDVVKAGDEEKEVKKIAITMMATVDVIRRAILWGADLLITHEPLYYHHYDDNVTTPIGIEKKKLLDASGITVYRYHDYMHFRATDRITDGMLKEMGISGKLEHTPHAASYLFTPDEPISALEFAKKGEEKIGARHVRIAGDRHHPAKTIAACFGTPGGVYDLLRDDAVDLVVTGETCEWMLGEYARDAALLGHQKALVVMGHIGSEKGGMRYLAKTLAQELDSLDIEYFECGDVYTYTDDED